ncbi:hypothetical protein FACS18949_08110 [Clostridia bacterium]|nr:hypothetical protein FACS18949_08110 [Clostridia bacterium]
MKTTAKIAGIVFLVLAVLLAGLGIAQISYTHGYISDALTGLSLSDFATSNGYTTAGFVTGQLIPLYAQSATLLLFGLTFAGIGLVLLVQSKKQAAYEEDFLLDFEEEDDETPDFDAEEEKTEEAPEPEEEPKSK